MNETTHEAGPSDAAIDENREPSESERAFTDHLGTHTDEELNAEPSITVRCDECKTLAAAVRAEHGDRDDETPRTPSDDRATEGLPAPQQHLGSATPSEPPADDETPLYRARVESPISGVRTTIYVGAADEATAERIARERGRVQWIRREGDDDPDDDE